jgi:hypothetical protein
MLTAHPNPDHVQYPRGVVCLDCNDFTPIEVERCLSCGSSAVALVEEGWDDAGPPHPGHLHHVEIDCSTGMVGYTRLTKAEIAERKAQEKAALVAEKDSREELEQRLGLIRAKAAEDPAFDALARHLGIRLEH